MYHVRTRDAQQTQRPFGFRNELYRQHRCNARERVQLSRAECPDRVPTNGCGSAVETARDAPLLRRGRRSRGGTTCFFLDMQPSIYVPSSMSGRPRACSRRSRRSPANHT